MIYKSSLYIYDYLLELTIDINVPQILDVSPPTNLNWRFCQGKVEGEKLKVG